MLDVFQTEKRYYVFDNKTFVRFLEKCRKLGRYTIGKPKKSTILDFYFDSKNRLLDQNNLVLRKRVLGNKSILKLKRRFNIPQLFYSDSIRKNEREKEVPTSDPLSKYLFFFNNALNSMYSSTLKFDPDNIFKNLEVILTIKIKQTSYTVLGIGGFKAEIRHQILIFKNYITKRKNSSELIEIKMTSQDSTLQMFEDFIKRIEKHCKEIFYTKDNKYDLATRLTKPLPSKAELKLKKQKQKEQEQKERYE